LNCFTRFEGLYRVNDDRSAGELEKLLGSLAAHPSTLPGGSNDCDIHMRGGSILDCQLPIADCQVEVE
jgi:hypothetical protein